MVKNNPPYYIKRLMWLRFLVLLMLPIFLYRLFIIAIVGHQNFFLQAKNQYYTQEEVPSARGEIFAHNKDGLFPLATNSKKYQIWAVPKNITDKNLVAEKLSGDIGQSKEDIFNLINNNKLYIPPIKKRLEEAVAKKIKEMKLEGILVVPESVRFYPEDSLASSVLGFVNFEGNGSYGVEGYYDDQLTGYAGSVEAEKDNKGRYINIDKETLAKNGDDLILTIDQNIQFFVEKTIGEAIEKNGAESGQVIVLDPITGGIMAMANLPNFNPNNFNDEAKSDQESGKDRFTNPLISYVWEPGSVIKPIIVAGGLDSEKIQSDSIGGPFANFVTVQGYEIHTAQNKAFGTENITQILQHSDNVGMVWVGQQIGKDIMYDNFANFGFGKPLGVDISGETTGSLLGKKLWREIHQATMTFGQGISATPLQVASAYGALANGGKLMQPYVVDEIIHSDGTSNKIKPKEIRQAIKPETAKDVQNMLKAVVDDGYGKRAKVEGYNFAGKTGTAQIAKAGGGYEENKVNHSFVGFGPIEDPKFVILVKLDKPSAVEFAETSCAPVFHNIAEFLINYLGIEKK
ncbi:hypothetical protein CO101_00040 [Candidatus Berkelbacteria bacterium CG_4_9_14_3_um_filter_39_23]|uniref:Penicillin-binding protein 2 n=2 Tax=Candidatus Berkelbacteria TaxID=1618330 RepID=A0A2M7CHD3_9BACT|nr:MAG: hypothetical protein AUK14_02865 [Candidatus Berkelbacteria bacterium CG2_30_39_44]PIV25042.1 MAG: hypothetical protein COS38_03750 [Candidatus Berkelbacteria bacterium CG03_land_8_20_14_0_80_40_36]PJB51999.1 MAG: hypothetical protein CO101_00040 [Candidatus Berkelbacteria bacterium CG_4_9_14_3_um_filter_39_23]